MRKDSLSLQALQVADHYLDLNIGNKKVQAPYYINEEYDDNYVKNNPSPADIIRYKRKRVGSRADVGKGSPTEIENTVNDYARKNQFDLYQASADKIRKFMMKYSIGIDCSGLVVWVLNETFKEKYHKPIWKFIDLGKKNIFRRAMAFIRPVQNISVAVLNNRKNSVILDNMEEIKAGDLIISWKGKHVILVTQVNLDSKSKPSSFDYINSSWWYDKKNGVRKGSVKIVKSKGSLKDQEWLDDFDENNKNWTYEGVKHGSWIIRLNKLM